LIPFSMRPRPIMAKDGKGGGGKKKKRDKARHLTMSRPGGEKERRKGFRRPEPIEV